MTTQMPSTDVVVRNLRPDDQEAIVRIDARIVGRRRDEFFKVKMRQAASDTGVAVSLAAEVEDLVAGFVLARVYYGEFGLAEPVAVLDVFGVHPDFRGRRVGAALLDQLRTNLVGLGIGHLQTEVGWDSPDLITFFQHEGFTLAPRLCLDLDLRNVREDSSGD